MIGGNRARGGWWIAVAILSMVGAAGCSSYAYDPVEKLDIGRLADDGCKKGERIAITAEVSQVYEDTFVLWDGDDPKTTYTLRFREPGFGRKTKGVFGKNRYESAYEALRDLMADREPVDVTLLCQGERKTPIATRFSYRDDDGEEIAYEF